MSALRIENLIGPSDQSTPPDYNYGAGIIGPSQADMDLADSYVPEERTIYSQDRIAIVETDSSLGWIFENTLGRIPGKRFAAPVAVLVPLFIAACSSGDSKPPTTIDTATPGTTATKTVDATAIASASPRLTDVPATVTSKPTDVPATATPEPTENSLYGVAPTFEDLSSSIDSALASNGGVLPDIIAGSIEQFNQQLANCNEVGLEGVAPQLYGISVINGCGTIAQVLSNMYQTNPTSEIKKAYNDLRSFTIGKGGKADQLNISGKLQGAEDLKVTLEGSVFKPLS